MSGILDSKVRVMDAIVTLEGRRQLAAGRMRIEHASFTDAGSFYEADVVSGSSDATARVYLEACSLPQDSITFEADDSGRLVPMRGTDGVRDGRLIQYLTLEGSGVLGSARSSYLLTGEAFASAATDLLASSPDHFTMLRLVGTRDALFDDEGFDLGGRTIEFTITDARPLPDPTTHVAHTSHLESIFQDARLSHLPNFSYLPPVNRIDDPAIDRTDHRETWRYQLAHYPPWGRSHVYGLPPEQLEHELEHFEKLGYARTVTFDPTSRDNRLVGQAFELASDSIRKLDVIDYGAYAWQGSQRHAFFLGRVVTDDNGTNTFVHVFTLVFG